MGQNRLNSCAIVCTGRSHGNKVSVNSIDKIFTVSFDVRVVNVLFFMQLGCVWKKVKKVTFPPSPKVPVRLCRTVCFEEENAYLCRHFQSICNFSNLGNLSQNFHFPFFLSTLYTKRSFYLSLQSEF